MMNSKEELEDKSKGCYVLYFSCLPIKFKTTDVSGAAFQEKLHRLFISEHLVTTIHKQSDTPEIIRQKVAEGISPEPPFGKGVEIIRLDTPIKIELNYSSDELDAQYYELHKVKRKMKTIIYYDGFTSLVGIEVKGDSFNYRRHAAHLQKWMFDLLDKVDDLEVREVSPRLPGGAIRMHLLKEATKGLEEEGWLGMPILYKKASPRILDFVYLAGDESVQEAIGNALNYLMLDLDEIIKPYYICQILSQEIEKENNAARQNISKVTAETLDFYDVSVLNFIKRFKKSKEIGKDLALLYVLMPQIEKLDNEYESHKKQLKTAEEDASVRALYELFDSQLSVGKENVFTQNIRDMLQQDVSEIRAQINYQFLFLTALLTFLAVIVTAIVAATT